MIHKTRDAASSSIDYHVLIKRHQVITLSLLATTSSICTHEVPFFLSYLVILVYLIHTAVTFFFRDDLTSIFHDDLVWFEAAVGADAIATVRSLDDLNTYAELSTLLDALLQFCK